MSSLCGPLLAVKSFTYSWNMANPSIRDDILRGIEVKSPVFPNTTDANVPKWIVFASKPYEENKLDFIVYSKSNSRICAKFHLSLLDAEGEKLLCLNSPIFFFTSQYPEYILTDDLTASLSLNRISRVASILCDVNYVIANDTATSSFVQDSKLKLSEEFEDLFTTKNWSDFTLIVEGHELRAHKAVLGARCAVFAAMFSHDTQENISNCMCITDLDYETVEEMLLYIYTGKAPHLNSIADKLLLAADKYGLEILKEMCIEYMIDHMTIEKAVKTYILADRLNADRLKSQTIEFIIDNNGEVIKTNDWKHLLTRGDLIADLYARQTEKYNMLRLNWR